MPVQIGICDDRTEDIRMLSEALYAYDDSFRILQYTDGETLLEDCLQNNMLFDIIFLDIYMPGLNGIETAHKIQTGLKDVKIIFVSSSNEHYSDAYEVFAFNYLIKPLNTEKLNRVLDNVLLSISKERQQQIQISYKGTSYRIPYRDILYIETRNKTVIFYFSGRNTLQCHSKLDEVLKKLPEKSFIRCHQSFAVNILHVTEMAENHFRIGQTIINISKKYHKAAKEKYFKYLFTHMNVRGQ